MEYYKACCGMVSIVMARTFSASGERSVPAMPVPVALGSGWLLTGLRAGYNLDHTVLANLTQIRVTRLYVPGLPA